jgi:hypothetical protein
MLFFSFLFRPILPTEEIEQERKIGNTTLFFQIRMGKVNPSEKMTTKHALTDEEQE